MIFYKKEKEEVLCPICLVYNIRIVKVNRFDPVDRKNEACKCGWCGNYINYKDYKEDI